MKEQIKTVIADKNFKEAFRLMQQNKYEFIDVLEAGYKNELKVKIFGLYTEEDWLQYEHELQQRLHAIVDRGDFLQQDGRVTSPSPMGPTIFISYSGNDREWAEKVYNCLKSKNINPTIDFVDKTLVEEVNAFILRQIKDCDYVLLLISPDSLVSGWVGVEHQLTFFSDNLNLNKFITVTIDQERFNKDDRYLIEMAYMIDQKLNAINALIQEAEVVLGPVSTHLHAQRDRLQKLRHNLADVFSRLKEKGTAADISGDLFEAGMQRICENILTDFAKKKKSSS